MDEYYDVVVVGAGPAGCAAAKGLSSEGFKVLLVERERLPREKPCAGFLPSEALKMVEDDFGTIPEDCFSPQASAKGAFLFLEEETYELPFDGEGAVIRRPSFDRFLAERSGAEVLEGWKASSLESGRFRVNLRLERDEEYRVVEATYLVGADGARSTVLEYIRPEFHRLYASPGTVKLTVLEGEVELGWDPAYLGFLRFKGGGATFFVKDERLTLAVWGTGEAERRALAVLERRLGLSSTVGWRRGIAHSNRMARNGAYCLGAGCALLAGEAAGLVDPWGHGLRLALRSGREAASAIMDSVGENVTPHVLYMRRMKPLLHENERQRKELGGRVGDFDTASLKEGFGSPWRRAFLRRRLFG